MIVKYIFCCSTVFLMALNIYSGDTSGNTLRKSLGFNLLKASGIEERDAVVFSEQFKAEIEKVGVYSTMAFSEVESLLSDQGLPNTCYELHCATVAGQLLGVDYFGFGSIGKVGKAYTLSVTVVEVRSGRVIYEESEFFKGKRSTFTKKIIPLIAAQISGVSR